MTLCTGDSVELDGTGGVGCSWLPIAGLDDASSCTPTASPASTTVYKLTVTAAQRLPLDEQRDHDRDRQHHALAPGHHVADLGSRRRLRRVGERPEPPRRDLDLDPLAAASSPPDRARGRSSSTPHPGTTMLCTVIEGAGGASRPRPRRTSRSTSSTSRRRTPSTTTSSRSRATASRPAAAAATTAAASPSRARRWRCFSSRQVRRVLHAAAVLGRVFADVACPAGLRQLDRGARGPGRHGRMRRRKLLPEQPGHSRADGGLLLKTVEDSSYLPPPATGTVFTDVPRPARSPPLDRGALRPRASPADAW